MTNKILKLTDRIVKNLRSWDYRKEMELDQGNENPRNVKTLRIE